MKIVSTMLGRRKNLLIALPLLAARLLPIVYRTGLAASVETFTPMKNHAAVEQGDLDACLRASDADDMLTLGPCPSGMAHRGRSEAR